MKASRLFAPMVILFLFSVPCWADLKSIEKIQNLLKTSQQEPSFSVFIATTEIQISKAKQIIDQAPRGLYITVGAERGFRAASLSSQITDLLLLDTSPKLIRFNRLNIQLIKAAPTIEKYRELRYTVGIEEWIRLGKGQLTEDDFHWWNKTVRDLEAYSYYPLPELLNRYGKDTYVDRFSEIQKKLNLILEEAHKGGEAVTRDELYFSSDFKTWNALNQKGAHPVHLTQEDWIWWNKYVGNGKDYAYAQEWAKNEATLVDFGQLIDFKTGNYLFDAKQFERLRQMALKDHIATLLIDLNDSHQVKTLAEGVKNTDLPIAVLDLDNTYEPDYMGPEKYSYVVHKILDTTPKHHQTILLVMRNYKEWGAGQFSTYIGFRYENVLEWPNDFHLHKLFSNIPEPIRELSSGRLYERGEMPPSKYLKMN